jgi:hypothetical protein
MKSLTERLNGVEKLAATGLVIGVIAVPAYFLIRNAYERRNGEKPQELAQQPLRQMQYSGNYYHQRHEHPLFI